MKKMKNLIKYPMLVTCFVTALAFTGCKNDELEKQAKDNETKYQEMATRNDALSNRMDSIQDKMIKTLDEIDQNLANIKEREKIISVGPDEKGVSKKDHIVNNIAVINDLLAANREKIDELNEQLKKFGKEKKSLVRIAENARKRMEEQENEIAALKEELSQGNYKIEDMNKQLTEIQLANTNLSEEREALKTERARLDMELHKAYFTYGTSRELKDRKIVTKKGTFLGLGKKLDDGFTVNKDYFSELDVREANSIPVYGKKLKFLSFHPADSYEVVDAKEDKVSYIQITKPESFWSTSKYLVVEVKQ
jgi:chromosome segregation ATPase